MDYEASELKEDAKMKRGGGANNSKKSNKTQQNVNPELNGRKKGMAIVHEVEESKEFGGSILSAGKRGSNKKGGQNFEREEGQSFV